MNWRIGVLLTVVLVLGGACGAIGKSSATPTPQWSPQEAKAKLRDYLISIAVDDLQQQALLLGTLRALEEASVAYRGDGWWLVQGGGLGWGRVTLPPTPTPTIEELERDLAEAKAYRDDSILGHFNPRHILPLKKIERGERKPPLWKWGRTLGLWRVSERTGLVLTRNDDAEKLLKCMAVKFDLLINRRCR